MALDMMTLASYCRGASEGVVERLLTPGCPRCRTLAASRRRHTRSAMPMLSVPTPLLFWTLLLATIGCSTARAASNDPRSAVIHRQTDTGLLYPDSVQNIEDERPYDTAADGRVADGLKLMELVHAVERSVDEIQEAEAEEEYNPAMQGPPLPVPQALRFYVPNGLSKEEPSKRVSYMSLCHFKICNMGRKRNLRNLRSPYPRL